MRSLSATRATKKVKKFAAENSAEPQWFIVHSTEPIKFGFGLQKRQKKV
jgi:hypothetical protein